VTLFNRTWSQAGGRYQQPGEPLKKEEDNTEKKKESTYNSKKVNRSKLPEQGIACKGLSFTGENIY